MFICNISLNKTRAVKWLFGVIAIILICFFCFAAYRIFKESRNSGNGCENKVDVIEINSSNYTNILKTVHDNLDDYVGKKIRFSGYIYRVSDFSDTQFVLARDMIISSDLQTLIVGFLCECKDAKKFETNTWVEITGTITKGNYHEPVPVIKVTEMKKVTKPSEIYVYPPDNSFVPTVNLF